MSAKVQLIHGSFQDAAGNVLANGYLLMSLCQDGQVNAGTQIAAGVELRIQLDANGNVSTTPPQYVWPNDVITPANTFYNVSAYTAAGQRVWGPNAVQALSNGSGFDIGTWLAQGINFVSTPVVTYDIGMFYPGSPGASETILLLPIERAVSFSASNLSPSLASAGVAATASAVFSVRKNGTQFATITFNPTGNPVIASSGVLFYAGDVLTIVAPSVTDTTLQNIGVILSGTVV